MAGLAATTRDLAELRKRWKDRIAGASLSGEAFRGVKGGRLSHVAAFGANPGALDMYTYVPERLSPAPALVVVLHGCTQTAEGYDSGSGWSRLADEYGFVLVFPQQTHANNPNLCFNWFQPGDIRRGQGEAASIRQMVEHAQSAHGTDRSRVFVTGLSAGGAMAAVMLATYPDVFAGGGVIAGLPYSAASNVQDALQAMSKAPDRRPRSWGDLARGASPHGGRWPILSVWHGGADRVVAPGNADALVQQWSDLHGLPLRPSGSSMVDGHRRQVWCDAGGREVIESFTVTGMGHGTPIRVGEGTGTGGIAGAFMLDVGISSTHHMASFWGLTAAEGTSAEKPEAVRPQAHQGRDVQEKVYEGTILPPEEEPRRSPDPDDRPGTASHIERVIENALRAAGLRR